MKALGAIIVIAFVAWLIVVGHNGGTQYDREVIIPTCKEHNMTAEECDVLRRDLREAAQWD